MIFGSKNQTYVCMFFIFAFRQRPLLQVREAERAAPAAGPAAGASDASLTPGLGAAGTTPDFGGPERTWHNLELQVNTKFSAFLDGCLLVGIFWVFFSSLSSWDSTFYKIVSISH